LKYINYMKNLTKSILFCILALSIHAQEVTVENINIDASNEKYSKIKQISYEYISKGQYPILNFNNGLLKIKLLQYKEIQRFSCDPEKLTGEALIKARKESEEKFRTSDFPDDFPISALLQTFESDMAEFPARKNYLVGIGQIIIIDFYNRQDEKTKQMIDKAESMTIERRKAGN